MRKLIPLLLALVLPFAGAAQQFSQFSYFTYNYLNYNPAVTGATPCMELKLGHRRQWVGVDGAPVTSFATVQGKFGKKKQNFHGIGGIVETDEAGPFSTTSLHVNYAYHMRVARKYMLSTGIGIGFLQYRMNFSTMRLQDQENDELLNRSVSEFNYPMVNFGLWLYNSDRFYGLSIRNIGRARIRTLGNSTLVRHLTLAYGRAIKMSDDLVFKPAALINYAPQGRLSLEGQALIAFKEKVTVGLGARSGNGISALLKLDVIKHVTIAYAFDLTMSKLRTNGATSHEITIGLRACAEKERYHVPCSAYD